MNSNNNFTHRMDISDSYSGILILKINKKEKVLIKKKFLEINNYKLLK